MGQDVISIGVDLKGFTDAQKKQVQDFIALFDKLEKYDGKVYQPVLGKGLVDFNTSIKETNKALDDLKSRIDNLNNTSINTKAKPAADEVNNLGNEVENTTKKFKKMGEESSTSLENVGRSLTRALGYLRTIAYILPGIGIAGIFNLAFEAIKKAADELGIFDDSAKNLIQTQINVNKEYKDFLDLVKQVDAALKSQLNATTSGLDTFRSKEAEVSAVAAQNKSILTRLELERSLLIVRAIQAQQSFELEGGFDRERVALGKLLGAETNLVQLRNAAGEADARFNKRNDPDYKNPYAKDLELAKTELTLATENYNKIKNINENNSKLSEELANKEFQIQEIKNEQIRKLALETAKIESQATINKNKFILDDERSTLQQRLSAYKRIEDAAISAAEAQKKYILDRPDAYNYTKVDGKLVRGDQTTETKNAINAANEQILEATRKRNDEDIKLIELYRQRRLRATTDISKDEIEKVAIRDEKIYRDETQSLDERLRAYTDYIKRKQKLQDVELATSIDTFALKANDPTAKKQVEALRSASLLQKSNIQADAEKQVYDIISTSLSKQLKAVLNANDLQDNESKKAYAKELNRLTDLFEAKKIKYAEYHRQILATEKKFNVEGYDEAIKDDKADIDRIQKQIDKLKEQKIAQDELTDSKEVALNYQKSKGLNTLDAQRDYDEAVGGQKAINDAILKAELELQKEEDKLDKDELARAKARIETLKQLDREYLSYRKKIIDELYRLVKTAIDAEYQKEEELVEKKRQQTDEQLDNEIGAIDKSTLTAKDKAQLDIQLNAQKIQNDKNAQKQEQKLKHDNAVADQKLSVAHIIWNTEEAISATYAKFGPLGTALAIEQAILGTLEVATVLATHVPSYAEGTKNHPGGLARTGEAGVELIKEPYRSPYLVYRDNISYLPEGTEVIPLKDDPKLGGSVMDESWSQTRWLANQLKKNQKEIKNIFKPVINIDLGFESYKRNKLHGT